MRAAPSDAGADDTSSTEPIAKAQRVDPPTVYSTIGTIGSSPSKGALATADAAGSIPARVFASAVGSGPADGALICAKGAPSGVATKRANSVASGANAGGDVAYNAATLTPEGRAARTTFVVAPMASSIPASNSARSRSVPAPARRVAAGPH